MWALFYEQRERSQGRHVDVCRDRFVFGDPLWLPWAGGLERPGLDSRTPAGGHGSVWFKVVFLDQVTVWE